MSPAVTKLLGMMSLFLFLAGALALFSLCLANDRLKPLQEHGREITGAVTAIKNEKKAGRTYRDYVYYTFTSNGQNYTGNENYSAQWNLSPGKEVAITYLPENPRSNLLTVSIRENVNYAQTLVSVALLHWAVALALFIFYRKRKRLAGMRNDY